MTYVMFMMCNLILIVAIIAAISAMVTIVERRNFETYFLLTISIVCTLMYMAVR